MHCLELIFDNWKYFRPKFLFILRLATKILLFFLFDYIWNNKISKHIFVIIVLLLVGKAFSGLLKKMWWAVYFLMELAPKKFLICF